MTDPISDRETFPVSPDPGNGRSDPPGQTESLEDIERFLRSGQQWLRTEHLQGLPGRDFLRHYSSCMDRLIQRLFKRAQTLHQDRQTTSGISILAMGGYGREELNPYSDIDILVLHPPGKSRTLEGHLQAVLHPLWDWGLTVGHTVQTPKESLRAAQRDLDLFFSFLDARWIAGDKETFLRFRDEFAKAISGKGTEKILEIWKRGEARHAHFGDSVFVLEPDLKEGKGGLRDYHSAYWAARLRYGIQSVEGLETCGLFAPKEWQNYSRALGFLWRVRNQLHYFYGRREDRLSFDDQESIASALGYKEEGSFLATEVFLKDYFRQALQIYRLSWNVIEKCLEDQPGAPKKWGAGAPMELAPGFSIYHGRLTLTDPGQFERNPLQQWRAFEIIHTYGVELDPDLEEKISEQAGGINDRFRSAPESVAAFRSFFEKPGHLYRILETMHETGFLPRFLPEFERVHCQVQYDRYHIYPVDVHSFYSVRELEDLEKSGDTNGSVMKDVMKEIRDPALLKMAALFHDLGKAEGSPHTKEGEKIAFSIGKRLGLSPSRVADLCFLVREHLSFVEIAHRRDLNDENLIFRFARTVENSERLKMLYLLCVADLRSVGPSAWTAWKDTLMRELFLKTLHLLEKEEGMGKELQEQTIRIQGEVMDLLQGQIPSLKISEYLVSISSRHYGGYNSRAIAQQILMAEKLKDQKLSLEGEEKPEEGCEEITVVALDEPGLFAKISGVLTANHLNILSAQISTWENGVAVDTFRVQNLIDESLFESRRWDKIHKNLEEVLRGEVQVSSLVDEMKAPLFQKYSPSRDGIRVQVDNESSDFYTIIEVYTHDRPGLLYRITQKLFNLELSIAMARISTKVDQVVDVFYVQDLSGAKVEDKVVIKKIIDELKNDLENIPLTR